MAEPPKSDTAKSGNLAFARVPALIFVALKDVIEEPFPEKVAVIVPALKLPLASLATIASAVFELVAVVALLETFPAVLMVANFVSDILAVAFI